LFPWRGEANVTLVLNILILLFVFIVFNTCKERFDTAIWSPNLVATLIDWQSWWIVLVFQLPADRAQQFLWRQISLSSSLHVHLLNTTDIQTLVSKKITFITNFTDNEINNWPKFVSHNVFHCKNEWLAHKLIQFIAKLITKETQRTRKINTLEILLIETWYQRKTCTCQVLN